MTARSRSIVLITISFALMTGEATVLHGLGGDVTAKAAFVRNAGGIVLVAVLGRRCGLRILRTDQLGLQLVRGALTVVSTWAIFYGFTVLPLAEATAIGYSRGVFLAVLAVVVLRERFALARCVSVGVGVIGCLLVLRPGFGSWRPEYLVVLAGSLLNAGAIVVTKILERRDTALTVMAYVAIVSLIACAPFQRWPAEHELPSLLAIAVLGPAAQYLGLLAIDSGDISTLAPFDFTRLVMAALVAFVAFGESPSRIGLAGAALITAACGWPALGSAGRWWKSRCRVRTRPPRPTRAASADRSA